MIRYELTVEAFVAPPETLATTRKPSGLKSNANGLLPAVAGRGDQRGRGGRVRRSPPAGRAGGGELLAVARAAASCSRGAGRARVVCVDLVEVAYRARQRPRRPAPAARWSRSCTSARYGAARHG